MTATDAELETVTEKDPAYSKTTLASEKAEQAKAKLGQAANELAPVKDHVQDKLAPEVEGLKSSATAEASHDADVLKVLLCPQTLVAFCNMTSLTSPIC